MRFSVHIMIEKQIFCMKIWIENKEFGVCASCYATDTQGFFCTCSRILRSIHKSSWIRGWYSFPNKKSSCLLLLKYLRIYTVTESISNLYLHWSWIGKRETQRLQNMGDLYSNFGHYDSVYQIFNVFSEHENQKPGMWHVPMMYPMNKLNMNRKIFPDVW